MGLNQNSTDNLQEKVISTKKVVFSENLNYLYPNGHRMTHQMRWFKSSMNRVLRYNIAA